MTSPLAGQATFMNSELRPSASPSRFGEKPQTHAASSHCELTSVSEGSLSDPDTLPALLGHASVAPCSGVRCLVLGQGKVEWKSLS